MNVNKYNKEYLPWHRDDEPLFYQTNKREPITIISFTLAIGASRIFEHRGKYDCQDCFNIFINSEFQLIVVLKMIKYQ